MCGIAGIVARRDTVDVRRSLEAMNLALAHRGPNGKGSIFREFKGWDIGMTHTRLAILDLSDAGRQPMEGSLKPCWLTYNGEVYNFRRLRKDLESIGCVFRSQADSEVVLRAYEKWGVQALARFKGMFGFGIWDEDQGRLILSRDPFGIKPLYFYSSKDFFLFSSEVRPLLASGLVARKFDPSGLTSYFNYGSAQAPLTVIEGVRSLLPGHCLELDIRGGNIEIGDVPYEDRASDHHPAAKAAGRRESAALLREILKNAVSEHLVSDVPLGIFLSGGLDSSALVALASMVSHGRPRTFSVVFADKDFSEAHYARLVADKFKTEHHEISLDDRAALGMLPEVLRAMDQPSIDGANSYIVSKSVREAGVVVALSGLGADELFAGYSTFHKIGRLRMLARAPRGLRDVVVAAGRALGGSIRQRKFRDMVNSGGDPRRICRLARELFSLEEISRFFQRARSEPEENPREETQDPINAVSYCELKGYMANTLLRDTDCMSMAHGLEVRVPFLDMSVARYVLGLPGAWKISAFRPKPLLLDALGDLLPGEVWRRRKMGFTLPWERWLRMALRPEMEEALGWSKWKELGMRPDFMRSQWNLFQENPRREPWSRPWSFYVLRQWAEINGVAL